MSMPPDPLPVFSAMLRTALGDLLAPEARSFTEIFAEGGVMEFPYAPPGGVQRLDGRQALIGYLPKVAAAIKFERMTKPTIHRTQTPGVVILEFGAEGRCRQTGQPYPQRYVSVITVRDGHITHYRDYWNPLITLRAMGGEAAVAAALSQGAREEDGHGQPR